MIRTPTFRLQYDNVDITADIADYLASLSFTDNKEGRSDEIQLTLQNRDQRWQRSWFPDTGATLSLRLGYEDERLLGPLLFEIDEVDFSFVPDICRIKAIATPITEALRQKNTVAYEDTTLDAIASVIAQKHGMTVVGNVPAIKLERVTQRDETDLVFLRDLAAEYGLIFKVDSLTKLVFYSESELENADAIATLKRADIKAGGLRKGSAQTYKSAEIRYLNPDTGEYEAVLIDADGEEVATPEAETGSPDITTEDSLKISERFESIDQGRIRATEALRRANRGQFEGSLTLEGNPALSAGTNVTLEDQGRLGGKYQIERIAHTLTKDAGYRCSVELKGIELDDETG